jgi:uncharacterized protein
MGIPADVLFLQPDLPTDKNNYQQKNKRKKSEGGSFNKRHLLINGNNRITGEGEMWNYFLSIAMAKSVAIQKLPTETIQVGENSIVVEVADESHERQLGLMHRKELAENQGMIFIYPNERILSFWMKNTHLPLSIAYVDKTGTIIHIAELIPLDLSSVSSIYPAQYALEVNRGWFQKNNIVVGSTIKGLPLESEN